MSAEQQTLDESDLAKLRLLIERKKAAAQVPSRGAAFGEGIKAGLPASDTLAGLAGQAGTAWGNLTSGVDPSFQQAPDEAFMDARDEAMQRRMMAEQAHPYVAGAGQVIGSLPTAIAGGIAAKGALAGANALRGAAQMSQLAPLAGLSPVAASILGGAGSGAVLGALGTSNNAAALEDLPGNAVSQGATGAVVGGVLGPLGLGAGKLGGMALDKLAAARAASAAAPAAEAAASGSPRLEALLRSKAPEVVGGTIGGASGLATGNAGAVVGGGYGGAKLARKVADYALTKLPQQEALPAAQRLLLEGSSTLNAKEPTSPLTLPPSVLPDYVMHYGPRAGIAAQEAASAQQIAAPFEDELMGFVPRATPSTPAPKGVSPAVAKWLTPIKDMPRAPGAEGPSTTGVDPSIGTVKGTSPATGGVPMPPGADPYAATRVATQIAGPQRPDIRRQAIMEALAEVQGGVPAGRNEFETHLVEDLAGRSGVVGLNRAQGHSRSAELQALVRPLHEQHGDAIADAAVKALATGPGRDHINLDVGEFTRLTGLKAKPVREAAQRLADAGEISQDLADMLMEPAPPAKNWSGIQPEHATARSRARQAAADNVMMAVRDAADKASQP